MMFTSLMVFSLLLGLVTCFRGYKLFRYIEALRGGILFATITALIIVFINVGIAINDFEAAMSYFLLGMFKIQNYYVFLIVAAVLGILLFYRYYRIPSTIDFTMQLGLLLYSSSTKIEADEKVKAIAIAVIIVILVFIYYKIFDWLNAIRTSFEGGISVGITVLLLLFKDSIYSILMGNVPSSTWLTVQTIAIIVASILLGIFGLVVQIRLLIKERKKSKEIEQ